MSLQVKSCYLKVFVIFILCTLSNFNFFAQSISLNDLQEGISPLEDAKDHYAKLKALSGQPRFEHRWMDTISFDPPKYNNRSILYSLVDPKYLTKDQIDFISNNINFPANSSDQTREELNFLLDLQDTRDLELTNQVMEIAKIGYWPEIDIVPNHDDYKINQAFLFYECTEVIGEECTVEAYPKTAQLMKNIMIDTRIMEYTIKYKLLRPRPYKLDSKLEPLQIMTTPSFASGHTLWAYAQAYLWSELMPNRRHEFLDLAHNIGLSREIMGIHYPSDEEAARIIAHRMLLLMWHNAEFQKDLSLAKKEWE